MTETARRREIKFSGEIIFAKARVEVTCADWKRLNVIYRTMVHAGTSTEGLREIREKICAAELAWDDARIKLKAILRRAG